MARDELPFIYEIEDPDVCCDAKTRRAVPILKFVAKGEEKYFAKATRTEGSGATLEDLVELCDQDAESVNAHDYCGAHRLLGAVLFRRLGRERATDVMLEIAQRRGLHGMNGLRGIPDAYTSLHVGQNGHDWGGRYTDETHGR